MTELTPDFKPEPDLRLTQAQLAMQQQLMELTGVAQMVLHLPDQRLSLNTRAYEVLGLDRSAPPSLQEGEALVHPDDMAAFVAAGIRSRETPGPVLLDYRVVRPDGRLVYLHARRYTERDAQGNAVANVILALDITERKRVESALLETAERFRALTALQADVHWEARAAAPGAVPVAPPQPTGARPASAVPLRKLRVLYVEDNMFNLMLFDEAMQTRDDIELRVAQDGAKGLDVARAWLPDLLVLDAHLPDIHGIQLLEQLRQIPELASTPAYICSGDAMPEHRQAAKDAGFEGYWTKPVDIDKVFADLDSVADRTVFS